MSGQPSAGDSRPLPVRRPVRVAIDAMGGDHAPDVTVEAAGVLTRETPIHVTLIGAEGRIAELLRRIPYNAEQLHVVDAPDWIHMDEPPREAIERKPNASLLVAAREVAEGRADALVSAGNTGAAVLACAKHFPRIKGVKRTAIAAVYPRMTQDPSQDRFALLLDVGATVHVGADELVHFALMGAGYASRVGRVRRPAVALLNIGEEAMKGGSAHKEAYARLERMERIQFVGNVEGCDIPRDRADVIVCDGFTGNVVLKTLEGAGEVMLDIARYAYGHRLSWKLGMLLLRRGLKELMAVTDFNHYGGAPVLGFEKLFIKCHGRSKALAIQNAVKVAAKAVRDDVCGEIAASIQAEGRLSLPAEAGFGE